MIRRVLEKLKGDEFSSSLPTALPDGRDAERFRRVAARLTQTLYDRPFRFARFADARLSASRRLARRVAGKRKYNQNFSGIKTVGKELRLVWLCDCSGSMAGAKISALNQAIKDCVASLRGRVETLDVQILVGAIQFGNNGDATWLIDKTPLDNRFDWPDLEAKIGNLTPTGKALRLLAKSFDDEQFSDDAYPPVLILISDGEPTDNFDAGFAELMKKKWGQDSFRCAIGVGDDVDVDALSIFTGNNADCLLRCDESCDKLAQLVLNRFVFFIDKPVWNVI